MHPNHCNVTTTPTSRRSGTDGEQGSSSAELVIVTPVLMLLILLAVQFGLYFHANHIALAAAEEGARAARARDGSAAAGQARADRLLAQLGNGLILSPQVSVTRGPDNARAEVRGKVETIVPGLHLSVDQVVQSPLEVFFVSTGSSP